MSRKEWTERGRRRPLTPPSPPTLSPCIEKKNLKALRLHVINLGHSFVLPSPSQLVVERRAERETAGFSHPALVPLRSPPASSTPLATFHRSLSLSLSPSRAEKGSFYFPYDQDAWWNQPSYLSIPSKKSNCPHMAYRMSPKNPCQPAECRLYTTDTLAGPSEHIVS